MKYNNITKRPPLTSNQILRIISYQASQISGLILIASLMQHSVDDEDGEISDTLKLLSGDTQEIIEILTNDAHKESPKTV